MVTAEFSKFAGIVDKTIKPFRYDPNQIPYDYSVDRVPDELWMEVHDIVQETGIKTIPEKKKYKKDIHNQDNDGVIIHLEPDILECEVKWALGSISKKQS